MTTKEYKTSSPDETEALAAALGARALASGRRQLFIAMFGEMGVGILNTFMISIILRI